MLEKKPETLEYKNGERKITIALPPLKLGTKTREMGAGDRRRSRERRRRLRDIDERNS